MLAMLRSCGDALANNACATTGNAAVIFGSTPVTHPRQRADVQAVGRRRNAGQWQGVMSTTCAGPTTSSFIRVDQRGAPAR